MDEVNKYTINKEILEKAFDDRSIHANIAQDYIYVTRDKLNLILQDFKEAIAATQRIGTYMGIVLTILLALVTSSTKNFLWFSAETWYAIFILLLIYFSYRLIASVITSVRKRKNRNIDEVCCRAMGIKQEKTISFFQKLLEKFHTWFLST